MYDEARSIGVLNDTGQVREIRGIPLVAELLNFPVCAPSSHVAEANEMLWARNQTSVLDLAAPYAFRICARQ